MNNLGYEQAMQLRAALMPIAYLLCTTGLILSVFRHWNNFHEVLMSIIGVAVIVILINGYPTALTTIADGFKQLREQTTANAPGQNGPQDWTHIFQVTFEQPHWDEIAEKIEIALCQMFKWIGQIAIWFLDWVQSWAFNGLIAISPVLLGALALPWTQGVGITFLTTSFGIAAWHLGISLVDILLASVATQLFASVGIGGGVAAATVISVGALPIFLGALAAIVCVSIALYLAVPIIIAAVLRGSSPLTTGAKAGIEMTLSALGTASLAGSRLAAHQAAAAPKSGDARTSDARRSEGDAEGGAGESAPVSPFPRPSGSSTFSGGMARGKSRATEAETSGDASTAISAEERQTQILAEYDEAGGGVSTQRSTRNPLKRRKSEGERLLAERDETYT